MAQYFYTLPPQTTPSVLLSDFASALQYYVSNAQKCFFVQIGANDGKMDDPLYPFLQDDTIAEKLSGIFVEPQTEELQKLKHMYGERTSLLYEEAAITTEESITLYTVKPEYQEKDWYRGVATVDPHRGHIGSLPPEQIKTKEVRGTTLSTLLEKHNVNTVDVLLIDTEGYDYEILKMIDFSRIRPAIIECEIWHLSHEERLQSMRLLQSAGYMTIPNEEHFDPHTEVRDFGVLLTALHVSAFHTKGVIADGISAE
jgi:FkbM family methyltransferase